MMSTWSVVIASTPHDTSARATAWSFTVHHQTGRPRQTTLRFLKNEPKSVICYLKTPEKEGILIDAIYEEAFRNELFWLIRNAASVPVTDGALHFEPGRMLQELKVEKEDIASEILRAEQSNTSVIYNNEFFFNSG